MIVISTALAHHLPLPDGIAHCCMTSPPYYSLRKYKGEQVVDWPAMSYPQMPGLEPIAIPAMTAPLGLESTPAGYIGHLILCFRELRRVLRDDGVAWIVMGDSFFGDSMPRKRAEDAFSDSRNPADSRSRGGQRRSAASVEGLRAGDLMGIPHRLMFALQADGWRCRNDVVWAKKSVMPESVRGCRWERHRIKLGPSRADKYGLQESGALTSGDLHHGDNQAKWEPCPGCEKCSPNDGYILRRGSWRHTRSHEYVLMLTKAMGYFCDQEKIREPHKPESLRRYKTGSSPQAAGNPSRIADNKTSGLFGGTEQMGDYMQASGANPRDVVTTEQLEEAWATFCSWYYSQQDDNPLSTIWPGHETYKGEHYAAYPSTLIGPLIRASCPTRCCPVCGAPWAVVLEKGEFKPLRGGVPHSPEYGQRMHEATGSHSQNDTADGFGSYDTQTVGYRPTCDHDGEPVPGIVLDPFVGSGTTLQVARELQLNAIGFDISPDYLNQQARPRIGLTPSTALDELPLFSNLVEKASKG